MDAKENKKKLTKEEEAALIAMAIAKMREGVPECIRRQIEETKRYLKNAKFPDSFYS